MAQKGERRRKVVTGPPPALVSCHVPTSTIPCDVADGNARIKPVKARCDTDVNARNFTNLF